MKKSMRAFRSGRFVIILMFLLPGMALSRNNIRDAFFTVYPNAVDSAIETVPSQVNHCGACHYDFTGGGTRNPYGVRLEAALPNFGNNPRGKRDAVLSIENEDPDGDGFSTLAEVTDTASYSNTPTFPGLSITNYSNAMQVDLTEIQSHLVPSSGSDVTGPDVTVIFPNGGETVTGNTSATVQWTATDDSGVAGVDIYLSLDNGLTWKLIAKGLTSSSSYSWNVANRPSVEALIKVVATDNVFNKGEDTSDSVFTVISPEVGLVPTTLRDFDMPGSQPFESGHLNDPSACSVCHGGYDESAEPYHNWQGSMMSQASIDPLFLANMVIANQDAPDSGDLCLRCHFPRGWLQGRSIPTDGSAMLEEDGKGVSCDLCHRLVDPIPDAANPFEDTAILAGLSFPTDWFGNGMYTVDPTGARRGPFVDAVTGHPILVSPFHRDAALCGTCHNVSNPAFEWDASAGKYLPNALDTTATDFSPEIILPVERTYSEWLNSAYNSVEGVYDPWIGGNKAFVSTCQDCHMRDVTGQGCNFGDPPVRSDLPLHDMTGGSAWMTETLAVLYPTKVNQAAITAGAARSRLLLQNAADLTVNQIGNELVVTVVNNTGHKLPTGYPEGRRMWINVRFLNASSSLIAESAAYDTATGELAHDSEAKIYEIELGLTEEVAALTGLPEGKSLHFALNNMVVKDNRIPPRGFTNANFAAFGGPPVGYTYTDGQYWDETRYLVPADAASVEVNLYYQSTSKEFVEFLRDENTTNTLGQEMYDIWVNNGKCPPELMATSNMSVTALVLGDFDDDQKVDGLDLTIFAGAWLTADGQPGWDPACDIADSPKGFIDIEDFAVMAGNWFVGVP